MNSEDDAVISAHYSLVDYIEMAGWSARPLVMVTLGLIILGLKLFISKPAPSVRWAYTIAASLPLFIGISGTLTSFIAAFSALGAKGSADNSRFHGAMGEIVLPLVIGLFGAAMVMTLAFFLWMRNMKPGRQ
jgi:hypothetical protein